MVSFKTLKKLYPERSRRILIPISIAIILSAGFLVWFLDYKKDGTPEKIFSAQLLVISQATQRPGVAEIGDIIGVFESDHEFSPSEKSGFIIIKIDGISEEQAAAELEKLLPDTSAFSAEDLESKVTRPKYRFNISNVSRTQLTASEFKNSIKANVKLVQ